MNRKDLEHFRAVLKELTSQIVDDAASMTELTRGGSGGQAGGELSNAPMHLGDMGTDEYLHDLNTTLLENEEYLAGEVKAALARLDAGAFGVCEACGKAIPRERLEALPYARHCVPCAEKLGSGRSVNLNRGRPAGPDDTLAPEGEMAENRRRRPQSTFTDADARRRTSGDGGDTHAAGTAGGGTAIGGLAGANVGRGDPEISVLQDATGSGNFDAREQDDEEDLTPHAGPGGGAVGGTPAGKRAAD
ncbi:MAG: TraR/DksA C4-type zinc finger protein [Planctomyces sp.]|nr:TraR/DksA C4-type zinc finger protein [Planctomyces sp.]